MQTAKKFNFHKLAESATDFSQYEKPPQKKSKKEYICRFGSITCNENFYYIRDKLYLEKTLISNI